jgi:tetratricopeptide (TPR) repeat protein
VNELRVIFQANPQADGAFVVELLPGWSSGVASPPIPFDFSLTNDDYEDLRWYLEDFMDLPDGGSVVRAHSTERRLKDWGRQLHDAVFSAPANQELLKQLLTSQEPGILTIGTRDAALLRLPWELIADEIAPLAHRVSVRRQLEAPEDLVERDIVLPLRILYIVSRPDDTGFIDPRVTTRSVFDALDPLGASVQIDLCRPPTVGQMEKMLSEAVHAGDPYDLVHFDGHGTFEPSVQLGGLYFEKPDDGSGTAVKDFINADRLGNVLAEYKVPLVILEACRSSTVGRTAVFRSVAPRLIQAGVNSVFSMGHAVLVEAARRLLDRFYRELVLGAPIGEALRQARAALLASPDRWIEYGPQGRTISLQDWFLPHLYQRGRDERLLPRPSPASASLRPRQFDLFMSHNHADSERVERLARMLDEKHGLRVWLDKWETRPGQLKPQCESGITNSRYTVVVGSEAALKSRWVEWEIEKALEHNPDGAKLLPIKFAELALPGELDELLWVDFTDPDKDEIQTRQLARLIRSTDAEDARRRRGFRSPSTNKAEVGAFPPAPMYEFQGRARELHQLERQFQTPDDPNNPNQPKRANRAIVLHAMGGMGKTALATEAAHWWTRSGLFRDGACFVSFEQFASAEHVEQILGTYLEGPNFESLPAAEQHRRAVELFNEKDVLLVWDNFESVLPQFNEELRSSELDQEVAVQTGAAQVSEASAVSSLAQSGPYTNDERNRLFDLFRDLIASPKGRGRLLITCRPGETGLPGALKTELQGLARPDSLWLLSRVIAKDGLTLNDPRLTREKLNPLLETLSDHPLSIELVAPHLKKLTPEAIIADFAKLVAEFRRGAGVERNESLLASLAFSTRRLSEAAQAVLPRLGMFSAGVCEQIFLDISELDPQLWEAARTELEATALIRVEHDFLLMNRPYLRFHPTLAYGAMGRAIPDPEEARQRFVGVYLEVLRVVDQALRHSNPRSGMELLAREEANVRSAVRWALADQEYAKAARAGETFRLYLERSGRLRERDAWVTWLVGEVRKGGFSKELAQSELEEAWTFSIQGHADKAIRHLQNLIERLSAATEFDPAFQLALTQQFLGRVLHNNGLSERAIPVLEETVKQWELLVTRVDTNRDGDAERGNLSATLRVLASALRSAGRLDAALACAEQGLAMDRELGNDRETAVGLGQCAEILRLQGRYHEADGRYDDALAAVRHAGDERSEATIIQHQGVLALEVRQYNRAASLLRQALKLFQAMSDEGSVLKTCKQSAGCSRNFARPVTRGPHLVRTIPRNRLAVRGCLKSGCRSAEHRHRLPAGRRSQSPATPRPGGPPAI